MWTRPTPPKGGCVQRTNTHRDGARTDRHQHTRVDLAQSAVQQSRHVVLPSRWRISPSTPTARSWASAARSRPASSASGRPRTPPAARTSAAPLSGPRRSGTRNVRSGDGLALIECLDHARVDQGMTEEAMAWECGAERLPMLARRLEGDLPRWRPRSTHTRAGRTPTLPSPWPWRRCTGPVPHRRPTPGVFAAPAPDWGAEDRKFKRQQALEAEREREAVKASLRAELAGGAA